jgi:hypothetical protein
MLTAFFPAGNNFEKKWQEVLELQKKGLPKSAVEIVNQIYTEAKKEGNMPQQLKALIFKTSLKSTFEEDYMLKAINNFEKELETAKFPAKQIIYSLTAELYNDYYSRNKWIIIGRGNTFDENNDPTTWGAVRFNRKIKEYYLLSLNKPEKLKEISLTKYKVILKSIANNELAYRKTLYDLLAERAINYFSSNDALLGNIKETKYLKGIYLKPVNEFINLNIKNDTYKNTVLNLYQHLLKQHINDKNPKAFVDINLSRLRFVYTNMPQNVENKIEYLKALENIYNDYKNQEVSLHPAYFIAKEYESLGNKYNPYDKTTEKYRYYKIKARDICKTSIEKFPKSKFAVNCKNEIQKLKEQFFSITTEGQILPNRPALALISFKNTNKLFLKIVKINTPEEYFLQKNISAKELALQDKYLNSEGVRQWTISLPDTKDLQHHSTEIKIEPLSLGNYFIYVSDDADFEKSSQLKTAVFTVTNLSMVSNPLTDKINIYTVERKSGEKIEGVICDIYKYIYGKDKNNFEKTGTFITDENGFTSVDAKEKDSKGNVLIKLSKGNDIYFSKKYLHTVSDYVTKPTIQIHLFTDRSIYRPGQTVYFKGIVIKHDGNNFSVVDNYETEISLKNTNYKTVSTLKVSTNSFGSFHGAFVIPQGSLNGIMRLKTPKGSVTFSVEEYKRPTFYIKIDTLKNTFKLNDTITITGTADYFNGTALTGGRVKYRVTRSDYYPVIYYRFYHPFPETPEVEIANDETIVDDFGVFNFSFPAIAENKERSWRFKIYVEVTDITGEAHASETSVEISNKAMWLAFDIPETIDINLDNILKISAINKVHQPVETTATLKIYHLKQPNKVFIKRYWNKPDMFLMNKEEYSEYFPNYPYNNEDEKESWQKEEILSNKISWKGDTVFQNGFFKSLKPGYYKFVIGNSDAADSTIVLLFSSSTSKTPTQQLFWYNFSHLTAKSGQTLNITIASAAKNTKVLFQQVSGNKVIYEKWLKLNRKQTTIPIKIDESMRGGFGINILTIKENRLYNISKTVKVPYDNKKLNIKLETKREFLTPGKKETWKVIIKGYDGNIVAAELLASMYDMSLDEIKPHQWSLDIFKQKAVKIRWESSDFTTSGLITLKSSYPVLKKEYIIKYPEINWFGMKLYGFGGGIYRTSMQGMEMKSMTAPLAMDEPTQEQQNPEKNTQQSGRVKNIIKENNNTPVITRTDFKETAFFFPQMHTDSTGSIIFSFTTPDALTKWKLMMLAYTPLLENQIKEYYFKAYKEIMIMPNIPRYVRQNDKLYFSARVVNRSKNVQNIKVSLKFFDALNNDPVNIFLSRMATERYMELKPNESKKVSWYIHIPDDINLLKYNIQASSDNFTDAEERLIPVLSNRMFVTETMPMYINAKEDKSYFFEDLKNKVSSKTIKNFGFTLEFTSNPAWYAIQALPYLGNPPNESAMSIFNSYFANSMSGWIMNSSPKIKTVIDSWRTLTPGAFLSALQKNRELKDIVLEETPWIIEAEDETEQKKRIALLLDINNISSNNQAALTKLQRLQQSSGAWPWFNGMGEDRQTTQNIVVGLAKLIDKGIADYNNNVVKRIVNKAISYLDKKLIADYKKLKETENAELNKKHISSVQIQYLYARSLLLNEIPLKSDVKEAYNYYLEQAKKYTLTGNNFLQALTAVILKENNMQKEAVDILKSLKERSLYNEELGIYWRNEKGWQWFMSPVETQAAIINAFNRLDYDIASIDKMKIWLLKQKQTQRWTTTTATAEAVYTLLITGDANMLNENSLVKIKLNGKVVDTNNYDKPIESGTGYFKLSWKGDEIKEDMAKIDISNPNNHLSWGAVYWQYFEDINKITSAETSLKVEKRVYKEVITKNGPLLIDIDSTLLKTGDKLIVRLIISTDRDMEFITLKDTHACGMEVDNQLSGYQFAGGLAYYRENKDASANFYIRYMNKGKYVLEYPVYLNQKGIFQLGIATIQSMYAPEFSAHSHGRNIKVE